MPAWNKANGGTLTDAQIADIVVYLRSISSMPAAPAATEAAAAATEEPVAYAQTKMTVTQSFNAAGLPVLNAQLLSGDDTPVAGVSVVFERSTIIGTMDLGTVKTNKLGVASLVVLGAPEAARLVDINFKGSLKLGSSSARIVLQPAAASSPEKANPGGVTMSLSDEPILRPEGSLITPNPPLVPTLLFVLVVLGVWSAYGYVLTQVIGIWKSKPDNPRGNRLTTRTR